MVSVGIVAFSVQYARIQMICVSDNGMTKMQKCAELQISIMLMIRVDYG